MGRFAAYAVWIYRYAEPPERTVHDDLRNTGYRCRTSVIVTCGIRDDPVEYASANATKPNSCVP